MDYHQTCPVSHSKNESHSLHPPRHRWGPHRRPFPARDGKRTGGRPWTIYFPSSIKMENVPVPQIGSGPWTWFITPRTSELANPSLVRGRECSDRPECGCKQREKEMKIDFLTANLSSLQTVGSVRFGRQEVKSRRQFVGSSWAEQFCSGFCVQAYISDNHILCWNCSKLGFLLRFITS